MVALDNMFEYELERARDEVDGLGSVEKSGDWSMDMETGRDDVGTGGGSKGGKGWAGNDVLARPLPDPAGEMMKSREDDPVVSLRRVRGVCSGSGSTEKDGMGLLSRDLVKLYIPGGYIVVMPRTDLPGAGPVPVLPGENRTGNSTEARDWMPRCVSSSTAPLVMSAALTNVVPSSLAAELS